MTGDHITRYLFDSTLSFLPDHRIWLNVPDELMQQLVRPRPVDFLEISLGFSANFRGPRTPASESGFS